MAGYPLTFREIREFFEEWALETPNARAIMRKAGVRRGGDAQAPAVPILSVEGSKRVQLCDVAPFPCQDANFAAIAVPGSGGKLYVWGYNWRDSFGFPLSGFPFSGVPLYFDTPTRTAPNIDDAVQVVSNTYVAAVLRSDGTVWVTADVPDAGANVFWGFEPLEIGGTGDVLGIAATSRTEAGALYFMKDDGTVWALGQYLAGTGPSPSGVWAPLPDVIYQMPTSTVSGAIQIAGSLDALAWRDGSDDVFYWHHTDASPDAVGSPPDPITKMVAGAASVHVLTEAGDVYSTGSNQNGQWGNGSASTTGDFASWRLADGGPYTDVATCFSTVFAITPSGQMYSWGGGGVLSGRGPAANAFAPVEITGGPPGSVWESVHGFWSSSTPMARNDEGCLYIWGFQDYGQFGRGYFGNGAGGTTGVLNEPTPVLVDAADPLWPV